MVKSIRKSESVVSNLPGGQTEFFDENIKVHHGLKNNNNVTTAIIYIMISMPLITTKGSLKNTFGNDIGQCYMEEHGERITVTINFKQ